MRSTSFFFVLLYVLAAGTPAGSQPAPSRTIIMFGADWCAPCIAELRDLMELARAAAPDRLVVAWTDREVRIPPSATELGVTQVSRARARELMERYGTGNAGLPLAVMLRGDSTRCAMLRRRLTDERIARMRKDCDARQ